MSFLKLKLLDKVCKHVLEQHREMSLQFNLMLRCPKGGQNISDPRMISTDTIQTKPT